MRKGGRPWTPQDLASLRELFPSPDYSVAKIALALDRSDDSVRQKARSLGLDRPLKRKIRQDPAGSWLCALAAKVGGRDALARLLKSKQSSIDLWIRTNRIPRNKLVRKLAEVSGESIEAVRRRFGIHLDYRTAAIIAAVRERFPRDHLRLAVVRSIEEEFGTVKAYAVVVGMYEATLRAWLLGRNMRLGKGDLVKIAKHEKLFSQGMRIPYRMTANAIRRKNARLMRRKRLRKKHHPAKSSEWKSKMSEIHKARWAPESEWRRTTGARTLDALHAGRHRAQADAEKYLAQLVKREADHFRSRHQSAEPNDVLWVLCRILDHYRQKFPQSSLTYEALPERVQSILGNPLRAFIRASGRPHDVPEIATTIRLLAQIPQPDPFWPEVSLRLYGTRDKAAGARDWWSHTKKSISEWTSNRTAHPAVDLMCRLFEAVLGRVLDPNTVRDALRLAPGRPARTPLAPV